MLPYSAAIDYAAYQTRSILHPPDGAGSAGFTHSWLVPSSQDLCGANFKPNHQQQQILDPGHVEFSFYNFFSILIFYFLLK